MLREASNCNTSHVGKKITGLRDLVVKDLCTNQLMRAAQPCQVIDAEPAAQGRKNRQA